MPPTTKEEDSLYILVNGNTSPEKLKTIAVASLESTRLLQMVLRLQPVDQTRFVDRADQVRRGRWLFSSCNLSLIAPQRPSPLLTPRI